MSYAIGWQRLVSTLFQVMACCHIAPSHHLNQCWHLVSDVLCIHLRTSSQPRLLLCIMSLIIIILQLLLLLPGAYELLTYRGNILLADDLTTVVTIRPWNNATCMFYTILNFQTAGYFFQNRIISFYVIPYKCYMPSWNPVQYNEYLYSIVYIGGLML